MDFADVIETLKLRFAWANATELGSDPHEKTRVFAVPPEWSGYFYRQVLAEAFAEVLCYGRPYSESELAYGRVLIRSIDDAALDLLGPTEPVPQARQRVEALMARLTGRYIPSHEELRAIAAECGCTLDRW